MDKWEYQNKPCYLENRVVREPCKWRTACTCILCHNCWTNWGTDPFSTSRPSEPQFYVDGEKLARKVPKWPFCWAGGRSRLPIEDEYASLLWRLFKRFLWMHPLKTGTLSNQNFAAFVNWNVFILSHAAHVQIYKKNQHLCYRKSYNNYVNNRWKVHSAQRCQSSFRWIVLWIQPNYLKIGPNWPNQQCCLAGSSQDFDFFSIAMGANYSFYVLSIATCASTFFGYIISVLAKVGSLSQ